MASYNTAAAQDNRWNLGMPLPAGGPLNYTPNEDVKRVGSGQLADPAAIWVSKLPRGGKTPKAGIEDIVQRVAVKVGATHAWIRSAVHNYGYAYDKFGNRIPVFEDGVFAGWKFVRKDNHITVAFGTSETHVVVHGHIYVNADAIGTPTGLMDASARKYLCEGDGRVLELWKQVKNRHEYVPQEDAILQRPTRDSRHGQASSGRPRWQEEFLMDHYCPYSGDDYYFPCPHIELVEHFLSKDYFLNRMVHNSKLMPKFIIFGHLPTKTHHEEHLRISEGNVSFLLDMTSPHNSVVQTASATFGIRDGGGGALALPIAVQALESSFLSAAIATSSKAPLWKGSLQRYNTDLSIHGFEHKQI
ncbi:hypothetical protein PG993_005409 [Apiospora rasikravindrae]|uniref:Dioxygenase n=1 Tax=Apiospora rasikravindrae TaxID=990691 RepID=A0ABR1TFH8_9PEZI